MGLLALGINHKTASLNLREKVAFTPDTLAQALQLAVRDAGIHELAILSTCNRTEFYAYSNSDLTPDLLVEQVLAWLTQFQGLPEGSLQRCAYAYLDKDAIIHMMRVASGLDSMMLGESQILGQMKTAYAQSQAVGTLGSELDRLFQSVFATAKQVHTETEIGTNAVSVGYAATLLARQIFPDLRNSEVLLIGAGEMIELIGKYLYDEGVQQIHVANRTLANAEKVAAPWGGRAHLLEAIPECLPHVDMVISCTAAALPIVGKGMMERAFKQRKHKPMLMIDIAVPRDIEPEVADLDDVYLYTVDDLKAVIDDNLRARQEAAVLAEKIVADKAEQYLQHKRQQNAHSVLVAYRQQVDDIRAQELEKALQQLQNGQAAEEVLERLSRNLANKFLHTPSLQLKQVAANNEAEKLQWAAELLGVPVSISLKEH
jgi:glutamyl-tRNA reductase